MQSGRNGVACRVEFANFTWEAFSDKRGNVCDIVSRKTVALIKSERATGIVDCNVAWACSAGVLPQQGLEFTRGTERTKRPK